MKKLSWRIRNKINKMIAWIMIVIMTITGIPIPSFADNLNLEYSNFLAGWKVDAAWSTMSSDYEWHAVRDEIRQPKLIITYRLENADRTYEPGDITFTIPGIGSAYRNSILKANKLVTDQEDSEWELTWDQMADEYIYTNKFTVNAGESVSGGFEMLWYFTARQNITDYFQELIPEFSVSGAGSIQMPPLTYEFTSVRDRYRIDMTMDKISASEYDSADKNYIWYQISTRFDKDWRSRGLYKSNFYVTVDLPDGVSYENVVIKNSSGPCILREDTNGNWGFYPFKDRRGDIGNSNSTFYDTFTIGFLKETLEDSEVIVHGHLDRLYHDEGEWLTTAGENEVVDDELAFTVDDYAFTHQGYIYGHGKTGQYSYSDPYNSRLNAVNLYNGKVVQFELYGSANRRYASTFSLRNRMMMGEPLATPSNATPSNADEEELFLEDGFPVLPEGVEDWNNIHWKADGLGEGTADISEKDIEEQESDDNWGFIELINDLLNLASVSVREVGCLTAYAAATPSVPDDESTSSIPNDEEILEEMDAPALYIGKHEAPVATYPGGNTSGISQIEENQEYSLVLGDDKLAVFLNDGSMRALEDEEYDITFVTVPSTAKNYDYEVWGAASQDTHFDDYIYLGEGNTGYKNTVVLPEGIKAVFVKMNEITGSYEYHVNLGVRFHMDWETEQSKPYDKRISHENRVVNFSYLRALYLTEEDQMNYEVNDCATTTDEYLGSYGLELAERDLDVYNEQLLRSYSNVYLRSSVTNVSANSVMQSFSGGGQAGFTTEITSSGNISSDNEGPLEKFSLYSVIPNGFVVDMDEGDISITGSGTDRSGNEVSNFLDHAEIYVDEYQGRQMIVINFDYSRQPLEISKGINIELVYPASLSYADYLGYGSQYTANTYVLVQDAGTDKVYGSAIMSDQYDIDGDEDIAEKLAYDSDYKSVYDDVVEWREFVSKYVKSAYSNGYVTDTVTRVYSENESAEIQEMSLYSYRLDFGLGSSNAKEIVFFDAIEQGASIAVNDTEGVYEEIPSEWQGTLVSVDTSHAESQGMVPTVYYSTDAEQEFDLTDDGWMTEAPADLSEVKSVAVHLDTSRLSDGMLKTKQMTYVVLNMRAPSDSLLVDKKAVNQYEVSYEAYYMNGIYDKAYTLPSAETYVTFMDTVGKLTIQKVDLDNQTGVDKDGNQKYAPLTGARFQVYDNYDNPLLGPEGKEVNSLGQIVIKNLPHGTYFYEELEAPAGYEKINGQKPFVNDELHEVLTVGNKRIPGSVSLMKEDSTDPSNGPLAGAVFELYREDGTQVSMNENYEYDENGDVWEVVTAGSGWTDTGLVSKTPNVIDANTSNGTYANGLNGYETITVPGAEKLEVTIKYDIEFLFDWVAIYDGTVVPDAGNAIDSVAGKKLYGNKTETYEINGDTVKFFFYSNHEDGKFGYYATIRAYMNGGRASVSGLPWGNYYFVEKQAPQGYELDTEKIPFTVGRADYDETTNKIEVSLSTGNSQLPAAVQFVKKDAENGAVLKDAYYDVFKEQEDGTFKKVKENLRTNAAGEIYIENLYFGAYEFREVQPPKGYQLNPDPVPFVLDAETAGSVVEVEQTDARKTGSARLHKTSEDGMPLAGAVYGLFIDGEETPVAENLVTDADGFTDLVDGLTWSDGYYFKELAAPKGYELDESEIRFGVNAGNTDITQTIYASDKRMQGSVKLTKMDEKTKSLYLEGAEFALYKTDGTLVRDDLVTGNDGTVVIENIDWGSFYLQEKTAPQGFVLSEEKIRFSVNQENCHLTQEVTCYNKEATGSIAIEKEILGGERYQPFGSTSFTFIVKGTNSVTGEELTWRRQIVIGEGQESGTAVISDVPYGSYTIREISNSRYGVSEVTAGSANVTVSETGAVVNLSNDEGAKVRFVNDLTHYEKDSQMVEAANIVTRGRKLTGISVEYKGADVIESDTEAEYTFTAADLDVTAFYDDGTTKEIPFGELTLDPATVTGNQNTSGSGYTVEVSYKENGIVKNGSFNVEVALQIPKVPHTITYDANGGYFGSDSSKTVNEITYKWESTIIEGFIETKVAHSSNVNDDGSLKNGYKNSVTEKQTVSIPGATNLKITVNYSTESVTYDYVEIRKNDSSGEFIGKLGGGQSLSPTGTATYTVTDTDTLYFYFRSDGSVSNYYGYHATIEGEIPERTETANVIIAGENIDIGHTSMVLAGWCTDKEYPNDTMVNIDELLSNELTEDIVLYAVWTEPVSTFLPGQEVNAKMKKLAGSSASYSSSNNTITSIKQSELSPNESNMTNDNLVSTTDSQAPIYIWFENGTIFWWSKDSTPAINPDGSNMFYNMKGLADLNGVKNWSTESTTKMSSMFYSCSSLVDLEPISKWNVSKVTDMSSMFKYCDKLEGLEGLKSWNPSSVTTTKEMFSGCSKLTSLTGLASWKTPELLFMTNMFNNCSILSDLTGLDNWDTSSVRGMEQLFQNCSKLTNLSALKDWNVNKVENMSYMFYSCKSLTNLAGLENWKTTSLTNMNYMFASCGALTSISPLKTWDVSKVTTMTATFQSCKKLTDISDLSEWDVSSVQSMESLFEYCYILNNLTPLKNWNVSKVTTMESMFYYCEKIEDVNGLALWNVSKVTTMQYMFEDCVSLKDTTGFINWDVSNVENMLYMFNGCNALTDLDGLLNWDLGPVTELSHMFESCSSLNDLNGLKNWDVSSITQMLNMFNGCNSLQSLDGLDNWDVSSVRSFSNMFTACTSLSDISALLNWNPDYVSDMSYMFYNCKGLTDLDALANWNTAYLQNMSYMFGACELLSDISGISNWNLSACSNFSFAFNSCASLTDVSNNWDVSSATNMNSMFSGCKNIETIDLSSWDVKNASLTSIVNNCSNVTVAYARTQIDADKLNAANKNEWQFVVKTISDDTTPYLVQAGTFRGAIPSSAKSVVFTDITAPDGVSTVDLSYHANNSVVAWLDGTTFYVSSQREGVPVVANVSSARLFYNKYITSVDALMLDVSNVTNMNNMFYNSSITELTGLANWDVSNVVDMRNMFGHCMSLNNLNGIENWDVSNVVEMKDMFNYCRYVTDVSALLNWNTSKVENMEYMFAYCTSLISLNGLQNFDVSKLTSLRDMFYYCQKLTNIEALASWDVSNVKNMSSFLYNTTNLSSIEALANWDVSSVENMSKMFMQCGTRNVPLANWDVSSVKDMTEMFAGCNGLGNVTQIKDWNVTSVEKMVSMFESALGLNSIDLSGWDITNADITRMFNNCSYLRTSYARTQEEADRLNAVSTYNNRFVVKQ